MKIFKISLMAILLGFSLISCQDKTGAESNEEAVQTTRQSKMAAENGNIRDNMVSGIVSSLEKRGTQLDSAQVAAINALVAEVNPGVEDTRAEFSQKRDQIRQRVLAEILTEEQRAARERKKDEKK